MVFGVVRGLEQQALDNTVKIISLLKTMLVSPCEQRQPLADNSLCISLLHLRSNPPLTVQTTGALSGRQAICTSWALSHMPRIIGLHSCTVACTPLASQKRSHPLARAVLSFYSENASLGLLTLARRCSLLARLGVHLQLVHSS
eukprot:6180290-Amphidinium_carterae.1